MERAHDKALFVEHEDGNGLTQYPTRYNDGRIVYDYPERVNKGIRPLIVKAFNARDLLEFARRNPGWHSFARDVDGIAHDLQKAARLIVFEAGHQFAAI